MLLRLSRFIHLLPLDKDRVLVVDAISHLRLVVDHEVASAIAHFAKPDEIPEQAASDGMLAALIANGILTEKTPAEELNHVTGLLGPYYGRDPQELLDRFRLSARRGVEPYFTVSTALTIKDFSGGRWSVELLLFGDCDVQMEADFLRREAKRRDVALNVAASYPDDLRLAAEHRHDAILIGALRSRLLIARSDAEEPHAPYIAEARRMLDGLRQHSAKNILIDNLPEPTVQPQGLAEHGVRGHRNRFRAANIALAELVEEYTDVHVVDIAATLGAAGTERLLDDGLIHFAHFGSPGWLLQRNESEKAAVHGIFPDMTPLAQTLGGDPYLREGITARAHTDALMTLLGLDRKKCVIVDLDGLLWPGVLAETGAPFAWSPEVSNRYSYIGIYLGLHEALRILKERGILLACVSKNTEKVVRELWKFSSDYDEFHLLQPQDFVTWRVNWNDKVENILGIADELGLALNSFIFLDDSPVERERVRQRLPDVEVWGGDLLGLRRRLLSDPRLQLPAITAESIHRTALARAQLNRQSARATCVSEAEFVAGLHIETRVENLAADADRTRVVELFQRVTQFNTTGVKYSAAELEMLMRRPTDHIFTAHVRDRFGDHGLVGAAVIRDNEIENFALSCRVLGMGVEHAFLGAIMMALRAKRETLWARIIETERNIPVRNLYRDNGFALVDGLWTIARDKIPQ